MVKQGTRTGNSTRNIIFSILAYMMQIILGFLARRYFIYYFNEEYLGLSSLFSNVLSLLSLAELGFGSALVFAMYKPMAENDEEKVRQLLNFYKKSYFLIGTIILTIGLCVLPFMNYFQAKAPNVDANLYVVYIIFLFNSVISYFFAHRRSLLYTNQRNDIESKVNMSLNLLLTALQLVAIIFIKNYYLYILLIGIIAIINNLIIFFVTQKMFPNLVKKPTGKLDKKSRKEINKNIFAMIFHKLGSVIVYSTDSLIIYLILGSSSLGKYSNYLLITTYITTLIGIFINAIKGSVGNSIASESVEKNYSLFKRINLLYMWIVAFCSIAIFVLADPFIDIILTKNAEMSLTFSFEIILLIGINFFFTNIRQLVNMFKDCCGLFYPDRFKPIAESIINLVISVVLTLIIGLPGVIIGTICSNIFVCLWVEPYVLNKHYFKKSTTKYLAKIYYIFFVALIAGAITYFICSLIPCFNMLSLVLRFVVCAIIPNIILLIFLLPMKDFKDSIGWVKNLFAFFKSSK